MAKSIGPSLSEMILVRHGKHTTMLIYKTDSTPKAGEQNSILQATFTFCCIKCYMYYYTIYFDSISYL